MFDGKHCREGNNGCLTVYKLNDVEDMAGNIGSKMIGRTNPSLQ
jgi:hypothetical protein